MFDVYADALLYIWPERLHKLTQYKQHINRLFWAYWTNKHARVINFDKAVRTFFTQTRDFLLYQHEWYYKLKDIWLGAAIPFTAVKFLTPPSNVGPSRPHTTEACQKFNAGTCHKQPDKCSYLHVCSGYY